MDWNDLFIYFRGRLLWRQRDKGKFSSEKEYKRWTNRYAGKIAGCLQNHRTSLVPYVRVSVNKKCYLAHRIIWEMHYGSIPEGMEIHHIDGDRANNKLENLRLVEREYSAKNKPIFKNNTSGTPGVSYSKIEKNWIARISVNGKRVVLYRGKSKEDAIKARLAAESGAGYHKNHGRPAYARL